MADLHSASRSGEERQILTMVRWLLYMGFVLIGYFILNRLSPVLAPVVAAAGVAYLLDGAVDWMVGKGIKRVVAVALLLVAFVSIVTAILVVVIPLASAEIARFIAAMPRHIEFVASWVSANLGWELPHQWRDYLAGSEFSEMMSKAAGPLAHVARAALGGVLSFLGIVAEMLLVPVFAFYFLVDWDRIVHRTAAFIPPRHRELVEEIVQEIDRAISIWIRGQLIVMAILAVLYAVSFKIIGIQLGVTIGIVVGLLTIIPFLGTIVGAGLTAIVVLLDWQGPSQLIAVGGVFVVLHLLEAAFLTPKIVGKKVGLGELGALFAVLAGGKLLGFTGVLLAVPIAASVAVLVRRVLRYYEGTTFFTDGAELHPVPPPATEEQGDDSPSIVARVRAELGKLVGVESGDDGAGAPESESEPESESKEQDDE